MDYILLKTCTRRWQVQCQGISVSQRVLDLLRKYDTNLSSKCRVSSGPWKPSNESSGLWKPRHLYDTLPWILKTLEYAFLWWSWKPWNKTFHKQKRNNHQKLCIYIYIKNMYIYIYIYAYKSCLNNDLLRNWLYFKTAVFQIS